MGPRLPVPPHVCCSDHQWLARGCIRWQRAPPLRFSRWIAQQNRRRTERQTAAGQTQSGASERISRRSQSTPTLTYAHGLSPRTGDCLEIFDRLLLSGTLNERKAKGETSKNRTAARRSVPVSGGRSSDRGSPHPPSFLPLPSAPSADHDCCCCFFCR